MSKTSFFAELQRRHVYKVGAAYAVGGWLLAQVVTQVLPVFGVSMLGQRTLVLVLVAGFPVALTLAWLFDVTPAGIVRTEALPVEGETPQVQRERRGMDRKLNWVLGTLVLLGVCYFVAERTVLRGKPAKASAVVASEAAASDGHASAGSDSKSLAVLPLVNTGGDPANEYFSDGLSEELIAVLAKIPALKVVGRNSSFHFKNSADDSRSIGAALGVAHLLEGSVRKQDQRVRIVAELVSAADGRSLWSETYDRELKDVFAVQSEIAAAVADQLKLQLLGGGAAPVAASKTANLDAYTALLQGDFQTALVTAEGDRQAVAFYEQALRADPGYSLAYARLSQTWRNLAASWLQGAEVPEAYARAREAANRAATLAPDLAEAHAAIGGLLLTPDLDFPAAIVELRRALALAPADSLALNLLAYAQAASGEFVEAERNFRRAIELDPLNIRPQVHLARIMTGLGRLEEASVLLQRAGTLQPGAYHQYVHVVRIDLLRHDLAAAARDAEREHEGFWRDFERQMVAQSQGPTPENDASLKVFIDRSGDFGAFQVAELYALRKEPDRMFEWLDRAWQVHDSGLTQLLAHPFIGLYKRDPRLLALLAKLKIDPAVLEQLP